MSFWLWAFCALCVVFCAAVVIVGGTAAADLEAAHATIQSRTADE